MIHCTSNATHINWSIICCVTPSSLDHLSIINCNRILKDSNHHCWIIPTSSSLPSSLSSIVTIYNWFQPSFTGSLQHLIIIITFYLWFKRNVQCHLVSFHFATAMFLILPLSSWGWLRYLAGAPETDTGPICELATYKQHTSLLITNTELWNITTTCYSFDKISQFHNHAH